jgi:hypothetical protein
LTKHFDIRSVAAGGSLLSLLSALPLLYLADHRMVGTIFVVSLLLRGMGQSAIGVPSLSAVYCGVPEQEIPMATTTSCGGWAGTYSNDTDGSSGVENALRRFGRRRVQSFHALVPTPSALQVLLLVSTLRLPRVLPKASEVAC